MTRLTQPRIPVLLALLSAPAFAQVQAGEMNLNLSGDVSGGYTGNYGNVAGSSHGFTGAGDATLTGFFYDPNFLTFNIQPYYNQSRNNSDSQSILASTGVNASTSLFSGGYFPASVSYSAAFNSSGTFGIPGVANYTTHGDSNVLNVGWSEMLPDLPHVSLSFQQGTNTSTIYGASDNLLSDFRGASANVSYQILGFNISGVYHFQDTSLDIPELFGSPAETSHSISNSYSLGIGHKLPFNGAFSASAGRTEMHSDYSGGSYDTTYDSLAAGLSFNPIQHFTFGSNAQYTDNLLGTLEAPLLNAGAVLPESAPEQNSHALDVTSYANFEMPSLHLMLTGSDEYREQTWLGSGLTSNSVTGTGTYSNSILGGLLTGTGSVSYITISPNNTSRIGFVAALNYSRNWGRWTFAGNGNYSLNSQTLLISYLTDSFSVGGTASYKFNRHTVLTLGASAAKSIVTGDSGSGSFSQNYVASMTLRKLSGTFSYSESTGSAILTGNGLVATSVLIPVLTPGAVILYGGHAYSGSLATTPVRGLTMSVAYSRAISNTNDGTTPTNNSTEVLNARIQYLIRRIYFQAGYIRLLQQFSATGSPPALAGSFYVGLARWFNFF